jgi:hypothetical protein
MQNLSSLFRSLFATAATLLLTSCESATDPRPSAPASLSVGGVEIAAMIDDARGAVVFGLTNLSNVARTVEFGGCDVALALYDRRDHSLRLDTRNRGCFPFLETVTVPPNTALWPYTRIVVAPGDIERAVPDESNREFFISVRFGSGEPVWLNASWWGRT